MTLSGINSLNLLLGFVEKVTALTGVCSFFQISREDIDLPHGFNPYLLELNIFLRKIDLMQDLDCFFGGHENDSRYSPVEGNRVRSASSHITISLSSMKKDFTTNSPDWSPPHLDGGLTVIKDTNVLISTLLSITLFVRMLLSLEMSMTIESSLFSSPRMPAALSL